MTPEELEKRRKDNMPDPERIQLGPNGEIEDHPLDAVKALEARGIDPNDGTIMNILTGEEKTKLLKMIKHGEFNKKEAAFLKYLIYTSGPDVHGSLDDVAAMIGAASKSTNGQPLSKQRAFGRLQEIMTKMFVVKGPKYGLKLKPGKSVQDFVKWMDSNKKMIKQYDAMKKAQKSKSEKAQKQAMAEFWATLKDLNKTRREHGLPSKKFGDLQHDIDAFPNKDGTRGLRAPNGDKIKLPIQSINYKGGSDAIDRKEGRYEDQ